MGVFWMPLECLGSAQARRDWVLCGFDIQIGIWGSFIVIPAKTCVFWMLPECLKSAQPVRNTKFAVIRCQIEKYLAFTVLASKAIAFCVPP